MNDLIEKAKLQILANRYVLNRDYKNKKIVSNIINFKKSAS